jgi:hypothetical protein
MTARWQPGGKRQRELFEIIKQFLREHGIDEQAAVALYHKVFNLMRR